MEQIVIFACVIGAGVWAWNSTGNVLLTILAVIFGGFIGSLIGFQIHQYKRMKQLGMTSRRELAEYDRDMGELRREMHDTFRQEMERLDIEAQAEGYASFDEKSQKEAMERLRGSAHKE